VTLKVDWHPIIIITWSADETSHATSELLAWFLGPAATYLQQKIGLDLIDPKSYMDMTFSRTVKLL